ncbi:MAG: hypothetical protein J6Q54_09265 [Oscillospiraceae bacterium]|nr:hypothetical protein [Oscillospiraceae bacterium]
MEHWLTFEEECTNYLNQKFGEQAKFCHLGGGDANTSDICVTTNTGRKFYIEVKLTPAHCGQFVLLPNVADGRFVFSEGNKTGVTAQVQRIIDHMNADFEAYKEAGTKGRTIDLNDDGKTFYEWIISMYRHKGTEFFITNDYTILQINDFAKHFDVTATYRVKRSGSSNVGKRKIPAVTQEIKDRGYLVDRFETKGGKLFVYASDNIHNVRFVFEGFEYMFSLRSNKYEVRRLSNTFNANVIFAIVKKDCEGLTDTEFRTVLK